MMIHKHVSINFAINKTLGKKKGNTVMKPSPRGLFQAIKGLLEATNMMRKCRMTEAKKLSYIALLMKKSM